MKFKRRLASVAVVGAVLGSMPLAFGWGSYGHQQINAAALQLMNQDSPLGACFQRNASLITRYAITPDYEWKKVGKAPDDEELRRKKASNDFFEHPLHFFEPDAFVKDGKIAPEAIASLPTGDYRKVYSDYQKLRTENEAHVTKMDPNKRLRNPQLAAADEVAGHGTAPWRIRQLYRMGVDALKKGDTQMAMYYLGTMGHYVGDMSQPFHGSLNYDGKSTVTDADGKVILQPTPGIHSVFETRMLADASKNFTGGKADAKTQMWSSFAATEKGVLERGREVMKDKSNLTEQTVTAASIQLVGDGFPYIEPLLKEFGKASALHPHVPQPSKGKNDEDDDHEHKAGKQAHAPAPSEAVVREFMKARLVDPVTGKEGSVVDLATTRMGDGAALLARMWNSAFEEARSENPEMPDVSNCEQLNFDLGFAIRNYPRPNYLPPGAYLSPNDHPHAGPPPAEPPPACPPTHR